MTTTSRRASPFLIEKDNTKSSNSLQANFLYLTMNSLVPSWRDSSCFLVRLCAQHALWSSAKAGFYRSGTIHIRGVSHGATPSSQMFCRISLDMPQNQYDTVIWCEWEGINRMGRILREYWKSRWSFCDLQGTEKVHLTRTWNILVHVHRWLRLNRCFANEKDCLWLGRI